jgi:hypothetical protein
VISVRPAPSRSPPSASTASAHTRFGIMAMAARSRSVMAQPTEKSTATPCSRWSRMWVRNAFVQPAVSARIKIGVPWRNWSGSWASAASSTLMWSAAVFAPALPGRSWAARNSRVLSQNAARGWNPNVRLNVAAAASFSLWQMTIEASTSITNRCRSRPATRTCGNARPSWVSACWAHTSSRARARAAATAARVRSSSRSSSRQHVESDATCPNRACWSASTAMSEIVVAPAATATARSTSTRPGSCRARGLRSPPSASDSSPVNVARSATSASSRDPTCEATPAPSAVTMIFGRLVVACTWKVPPRPGRQGLRHPLSYLVTRHFLLSGHPHPDTLMKSQG